MLIVIRDFPKIIFNTVKTIYNESMNKLFYNSERTQYQKRSKGYERKGRI